MLLASRVVIHEMCASRGRVTRESVWKWWEANSRSPSQYERWSAEFVVALTRQFEAEGEAQRAAIEELLGVAHGDKAAMRRIEAVAMQRLKTVRDEGEFQRGDLQKAVWVWKDGKTIGTTLKELDASDAAPDGFAYFFELDRTATADSEGLVVFAREWADTQDADGLATVCLGMLRRGHPQVSMFGPVAVFERHNRTARESRSIAILDTHVSNVIAVNGCLAELRQGLQEAYSTAETVDNNSESCIPLLEHGMRLAASAHFAGRLEADDLVNSVAEFGAATTEQLRLASARIQDVVLSANILGLQSARRSVDDSSSRPATWTWSVVADQGAVRHHFIRLKKLGQSIRFLRVMADAVHTGEAEASPALKGVSVLVTDVDSVAAKSLQTWAGRKSREGECDVVISGAASAPRVLLIEVQAESNAQGHVRQYGVDRILLEGVPRHIGTDVVEYSTTLAGGG